MTAPEKLMLRFRRRLALLLLLRSSLACATAWAFAWGVAVLVLRATAGTQRPALLWGLAGLPFALAPAVWLTRRRLPSLSAVRALLDAHNGYGGVLMAAEDLPLGRWRETLDEPELPRLRWRGRRPLALFAAGAAFVAAGFLVPERFAARGAGPGLEIGRETSRLSAQIQVLKEEKILDPARADDLQKKLTQAREQSSGRDPARTLEALDHVGNVARQKAHEATEAALRKTEQLARAEELADALRKKQQGPKQGGLGDKARKEAMKELARLTREAGKERNQPGDRLDKLDRDLLDRLQDKGLSADDLKKLADALRQGKAELKKMLGKLEKASLIDANKLKECERGGSCDGKELADFLEKNEGKMSVAQLMRLWSLKNRPGKGGTNQGPAPTELTFGKPSPEIAKQLKEEALPPAALADLKESKLRGVSPSAPKVDRGGKASSGALAGAATGGGSANTQVVLPRHRGAVERYFSRPK